MADGKQNDKESRIREEAFLLWNADGRPEGRSDEYWLQAERVIEPLLKRTKVENCEVVRRRD